MCIYISMYIYTFIYLCIYIYIDSSAFFLYVCIVLDLAIKLIWCTGMQGLNARLTRGAHLFPLYISSVVVCKVSVIN